MNRQIGRLVAFPAAILVALLPAAPAFAHHVMGGKMPATFMQGLLSGLGHPVIGLDHFAAVVAVGCLAAAHRAGAALAIGFVVAMMAGVAAHLQGASVPGAEILVALSVIVLGAVLLAHREIKVVAALALFVIVGSLHGYALGESIYGAEQTPLVAYLVGLCVIQSAIDRAHRDDAGARGAHADKPGSFAAADRRRNCRHRIDRVDAAAGSIGLIVPLRSSACDAIWG